MMNTLHHVCFFGQSNYRIIQVPLTLRIIAMFDILKCSKSGNKSKFLLKIWPDHLFSDKEKIRTTKILQKITYLFVSDSNIIYLSFLRNGIFSGSQDYLDSGSEFLNSSETLNPHEKSKRKNPKILKSKDRKLFLEKKMSFKNWFHLIIPKDP